MIWARVKLVEVAPQKCRFAHGLAISFKFAIAKLESSHLDLP